MLCVSWGRRRWGVGGGGAGRASFGGLSVCISDELYKMVRMKADGKCR